ncbi:Iqg1 protein [Maudiozyma humilis]|uniref:Iqg1 protein n=1 Tax=Maudiozyma humilis TaxID=51915 RepID=A0AAV5RWV9_MAUHU|nr:Iqg1 protein [Kazachstania humilis]
MNPFIDRYMQSVNETSPVSNKPALLPVSPSRMNLASPLPSTPTKFSSPKLSSPFGKSPREDKENSRSLSRSPVLKNLHESTLSHHDTLSMRKTISVLGDVDTTQFSKTELKYYEFLCRVGEVKRWIEQLIGESLPVELQLCTGDALRNGVYLAQVTQIINPDLAPSIFPAGSKLQFKHTQNINTFLSLVDHVGVPDSFRFELQDLYNKKDIPQVFETLYILITMINRKWPGKTTDLENLSGKLEFTKEEIRKCQRAWPRIRDFRSLGSPAISPAREDRASKTSPGLIQDFSKFNHPKLEYQSESPSPSPIKSKPVVSQPIAFYQEEVKISPMEEPKIDIRPKTPLSFVSRTPTQVNTSPTFRVRDNVTPRLQYSPIKSTSLSYYTPTISNYLTHDSDFYLRRSQNRTNDIQYYNNYELQSPVQYSPQRKQKMTEYEFLDQVTQIQNHCRGVNVRFNLFMQRRVLKLFEDQVVGIQSRARSYISRKSLDIPKVEETDDAIFDSISALQAIITANRIRNHYDMLRIHCMRRENVISKFQSYAKGCATRRLTTNNMHNIESIRHTLLELQGTIRGHLLRGRLNHDCLMEQRDGTTIHQLTAHAKAVVQRRRIVDARNSLRNDVLPLLQSTLRGSLERRSYSTLQKSLDPHHDIVYRISAHIKGSHIRKSLKHVRNQNYSQDNPIPVIQGIVRGLLVRYTLDLVDEVIESNFLTELQANVRGALIRSNLHSRNNLFSRNERSIITIQSAIRTHLQYSAYQELMTYPNPSLWAVRKFTYLLNNCSNIESLQNKLETCQASLDAENLRRDNTRRLLREQVEMVQILQKFGMGSSSAINEAVRSTSMSDPAYENMENLFYLLQVNPLYWRIMFKENPEFVEKNLYQTFTTMNKKMEQRERTYFARLLSTLLQHSMANYRNVTEFLVDSDQFWERQSKLFLQKECSASFSLFLSLAEFLDNPEIDFENDPYRIYENIHHVHVQHGVSPIEDRDVKRVFIQNLRNIWHSVELVADIFTRQFEQIPVEIKYLCTKIFGFAADKNADELDSLRAVSKILIEIFVGGYVQDMEYYGFSLRDKQQTTKKVKIFLSVLTNVFEIKSFEGYFEPLNQYADEIKPHIRNILYNVMIDPEYEQQGDRLIYEDMIAHPPRLEMLAEKAKEICHEFIETRHSYPDNDIIQDVLKAGTKEKSFPTSGRVTLQLNASVYRFLVADDQMRKLYDQVKRSIVYMTQIEEVDSNVYDLVVSGVIPQDEPHFTNFISSNPVIKSDPMIKGLEPCTYFNLKNVTLKKIHDLESAGLMSSSDNKFQNLLNDIANTVKNPTYAIDYVSQELETTRRTLRKLKDINQGKDTKLAVLKGTVQKIIRDAQSSRNYLPAHKSTFGNIKSAYKNLQHKSGSELNGLKFKWTTRQLYEKGVVVSIVNEKLGEQTVKVFGSSGPKFPDIMFKISTADGARYGIQMIDKRKSTEKRHSDTVDSFTFTGLIKSQAGMKEKNWDLLNSKVSVDTSKLLKLVVDTFLS